jgi:hypothetical protein
VVPDKARQLRQLADEVHTLVWVRAVSHEVTETQHRVVFRRVVEDGFQGLQIGMNVGKDEVSHRCLS